MLELKVFKIARIKLIINIIVPTITWKPWKPVNIKKHEEYILSLIEKGENKYSKDCNPVKRIAKNKVIIKEIYKSFFFTASIIAIWAQVTDNPDNNKIKVFNRGIPKYEILIIPAGGQTAPSQIEGDKLLCKKAQKKEKNNITSEERNQIKDWYKLFWIIKVCSVSPSFIIFINHL